MFQTHQFLFFFFFYVIFFLFSFQEVGSIIGKKGEIVKRFREEVSYALKIIL